MTIYYIFEGNGDCGSCQSMAGYYTIAPARPHENCRCNIVMIEEKDCNGEWSASGLGGARAAEPGYLEQDFYLEVTQPDGSIDADTITIKFPEDMDPYDLFDHMEDALEAAASEISEPCKPFLCC